MIVRSFGRFGVAVVIQVICFMAIGYIALSPHILNPDDVRFSFTIFGFTGVLLFNSLESKNRNAFLALSGITALLFLLLWFENDTVVSTLTNIFWFVLISGFAFVTWRLLQPDNVRNSLFLPLIVWLATWIAVYLVMTILDVFVFNAPRHVETVSSSWFFLRGIANGAVLGFGVGVGYVITQMLAKKQPGEQESHAGA